MALGESTPGWAGGSGSGNTGAMGDEVLCRPSWAGWMFVLFPRAPARGKRTNIPPAQEGRHNTSSPIAPVVPEPEPPAQPGVDSPRAIHQNPNQRTRKA